MSGDLTSYDPPPKPGVLAPPAFELQYLLSFNYIFENPNWFANVAFVGLVGLVSGFIPMIGPFVGQLVTLGYTFDIVESLLRTNGRRYPDFSFDRLGDYIMRGLWPLLAGLAGGIPIFPLVIAVGVAIFALWGGFAAGNANGAFGNVDPSPVLIAVSVGLGTATLLIAWLYSILIVFPMTLRAGLSQDLGQAFKLNTLLHFSGKVWFETILVNLFIAASTLVLVILGLLVFCMGHYFTIALVSLAQAHLTYQIYKVYLSRGGEEIPLKVPPIMPAVQPMPGQFMPAAVPGGNPFAQTLPPELPPNTPPTV